MRYLRRSEVAALLPDAREQVRLAESTYGALADGRVELPPKPGIHPRDRAFIHAMPAYLEHEDVAAMKWVSGYPDNQARGLPYISGLIVVNDPATGVPVAILDAAEITAARTAAASGACIERFAPEGWTTAAILGCGEQGRFHADVMRAVNPSAAIRAFDVDPERAATLGRGSTASGSAREAATGAEVVVTAGPIVKGAEAPIDEGWLAERCLLLPIDFDFYVAADAVRACDLFLVDDVGQFDYYRSQGHFRGWPAPDGSVGETIRDRPRGDRVVCCNLGVGALDAAFAKRVLDRAVRDGAGIELPR